MSRFPTSRSLPAALALVAATWLPACGGGDGADAAAGSGEDAAAAAAGGADAGAAADTGAAAGDAERQAPDASYVVRDGLLIRRDAAGERPILALRAGAGPEGVPALPATWSPGPDASFRVQAADLRHVVPSPAGDWVAWETEGVHDLVGVAAAEGGRMSVLDFYFDSSARELTWAPDGRYLMALYLPPSGLDQARVYDAEGGARLRTPWGEACRPRDGCRVDGAAWTGPTTLAVTTVDGEERRHEVDVTELEPRASGGG